jgi:nucleoside-diphosphate-sugar epimerase
MGDMVFSKLVAGKKAQVGGSATMPHSVAYIEDVGQAAAALGTNEAAIGQVWFTAHAPASTQGEMVEMACQALTIKPQISVISPLMMRLAGLFIPEARATVEMMYEFTEPFVVDSSHSQQVLALTATPLASGIEKTATWFKEQAGKN